MNKLIPIVAFSILFLVPIATQEVYAATITFPFKAVVYDQNFSPLPNDDFKMGTDIVGFVKFDSNAPGTDLGSSTEYDIIEMEVTYGSSKFISSSPNAVVRVSNDNGQGSHFIAFIGDNPVQQSGTPVNPFSLNLSFRDNEATVFSDESLPTTLPDVDLFEFRNVQVRLDAGNGDVFNGVVTDLINFDTLSCGQGTIIENGLCVCQQLGSMIGGTLLEINTIPLLVGAIGSNPIITGLVGVTIAGVGAQAFWFVHQRKKNNS